MVIAWDVWIHVEQTVIYIVPRRDWADKAEKQVLQ